MRIFLLTVFLSSLIVPGVYSQDSPDILKMILDSVGFSRDDLGYEPEDYWSRYPHSMPYKSVSYDDLFAEPLKLYDYSKIMANAAEIYLSPSYLDSNSDALYKLTYTLGVDKKPGGFRGFPLYLSAVKDTLEPIRAAVDSLLAVAGRYPNFSTYGDRDDWGETKSIAYDFDDELKGYAPRFRRLLADIILNIAEIIEWRNIALRNCRIEDIREIYRLNAEPIVDYTQYFSVVQDVADRLDYNSLHYAALKTSVLAKMVADSLGRILQGEQIPELIMPTPFGDIIFIDKKNAVRRKLELSKVFVLIDNGAQSEFYGPFGACIDEKNPVSLVIDMGGDDLYASETDFSAGAGILGIGLLMNVEGNDRYIGNSFAQGSGLFGVGILFDRQGNDIYSAKLLAQGAGYFGVGLLIDGAGNDSCYIHGFGQGFGGHGGGVGVLADYDGDDMYIAELSPEVFDRSDYHSDHKINENFVQGVGYGRRADLSDGHSYAGGVGAIIDISGNDYYLSGNWSLGTGYWFATGIAYDGSGDDIYKSCYFTQGSGAHFCNGILIDEGGNDRHELYETAGAALGFGWDFTNAFLINIGGDDSYRANMISIGCAEVRSNAFFIDIGGNDLYRVKSGALVLGAVDYREYYFKPAKLQTYFTDAKSIGGFIDVGGQDVYTSFTDSTEFEHPAAGNNKCWFKPEKSDSTYGADNYGIGIDIEEGTIPEIERWK